MLYVPLLFYLFDRMKEGRGEKREEATPAVEATTPGAPAAAPKAEGDQ